MMESNRISKIIVLLICLLFVQAFSYAQEEEEAEYDGYTTKLSLSYVKNTNNVKTLSCVVTAKKGEVNLPLENAELKFYAGNDQTQLLGVKTTNNEGFASLDINTEMKLQQDDSGAVLYRVEYKGLENSKDAVAEVSVVDINMEISLEEIDSVKTITVKATRIGKNNEIIPVKGQDVTIFVKRLYSNLKIGEVYLDDEEGIGSTEFKSIPGDSVGNILIIAKIEGHELYAAVEKSQEIRWGSIVAYDVESKKRELWTNEAPIWMAITLAIFMIGVWYHLIRVFVKMRKIKKMGEQIEGLA